MKVAHTIADRYSKEGAEAVYLTGSWARGDAHQESDLDIRVIGPERDKHLFREGGFLVSSQWMPAEEQRAGFDDPAEVGSVVPGWRSAVILSDPSGTAARLKEEAENWTWERVESARNDLVGQEMAKYAEELHSLVGNLDQDLLLGAAIQRNAVAGQLAPILALHLKILYETEKELWDLVAERMGDGWEDTQKTALGVDGSSFLKSCVATFRLFNLAASEVDKVLSAEQREVVNHTRDLADQAIEKLT